MNDDLIARLPPLPKPKGSLNWTPSGEDVLLPGYTEEQMREYAADALAQQAGQAGAVDEALIHELCPYIKGSPDECMKCPDWYVDPRYGKCKRACRAMSEEAAALRGRET